jgi:hypothetical protein
VPTVVAFSAETGDFIIVEEELEEANEKLAIGNAGPSGLCRLTQVPGDRQTFAPAPVLINRERVAYLRPPAGG